MFSKATKWVAGCVWASVVVLGFGYASGGCLEIKDPVNADAGVGGQGGNGVVEDEGLIPGQYIVVLNDDGTKTPDAMVALLNKKITEVENGKGTKLYSYAPLMYAFAAKDVTEDVLRGLKSDSAVKYVEQDRLIRPTSVQSCTPSWGLDRIDQRELPLNDAYVTSDSEGAGVDVYVFDTGIDATNTEFAGREIKGYNALPNEDTKDWKDCNEHGTHVASVLGGNKYGVAKKANLFAIRIFKCDASEKCVDLAPNSGIGAESAVGAGINYINTGKNGNPLSERAIVLLNFEVGGAVNFISNMVAASKKPQPLYIISAGNKGSDSCKQWYGDPALQQVKEDIADFSLVVGSSGKTDIRSVFSNYGLCVNLFAPGEDIDGPVCKKQRGTSMAAAHVAGVAARKWAETKTKNAADIKLDVASSPSIGNSDAQHGAPIPIVFADFDREYFGIPCKNANPPECNFTVPGRCCNDKRQCNEGLMCEHGACDVCGVKDAGCCKASAAAEGDCGANLKCVGDTCTCGAVNQPCCDGTTCNDGFSCKDGACLACGGPEGPCCTTYPNCAYNSLTCDGKTCIACGGLNDPCCNDFPKCGLSTLECNGTTCAECGVNGTPCCKGNQCFNGAYCDIVPNTPPKCKYLSCESRCMNNAPHDLLTDPIPTDKESCEAAGLAACGGAEDTLVVRYGDNVVYCNEHKEGCYIRCSGDGQKWVWRDLAMFWSECTKAGEEYCKTLPDVENQTLAAKRWCYEP